MTDFPLPHASHDLTGEVALVTGATSGLGWRFARVLASVGAKVAIAGRREERLAELAKLISDEGGEAVPIVADMTDNESVLAMHCRWIRKGREHLKTDIVDSHIQS